MVSNLKRIILFALFALSFAAAHPFHVLESREQHDRRVPIPLVVRVIPTEGAVARDLIAPITTSVTATESPAYNSATVTSIILPTSLVPTPLVPTPLVPTPLVPTPLVPTPLVAKEIGNQVPPIGAVAVVKHTYPPINITEIEAAAVLIPIAAAGGAVSNALNNPLLPFQQNNNKENSNIKAKSSQTTSSSTTESFSTTTPTSSSQPQQQQSSTNIANSSVLQAAAGIGVGLAGVAASAIGAYYYIQGRKKQKEDKPGNNRGVNGEDKDKPQKGIVITPRGLSKDFVDSDDENNATKSSTKEDTIFGSQAASTSMVDLGQDTAGSVVMERHHSD
ncbi:24417_t:CDS:1 [Cetraspora pellucida]|uniref:24417_t:CDS:1 n=1 Tax=Cetraspora pellucida TaxID=1433469 RepID=A0A9N9BL65_9GLOM|nr:24417_t:CDS:1 [Cetraspora pellucida]